MVVNDPIVSFNIVHVQVRHDDVTLKGLVECDDLALVESPPLLVPNQQPQRVERGGLRGCIGKFLDNPVGLYFEEHNHDSRKEFVQIEGLREASHV